MGINHWRYIKMQIKPIYDLIMIHHWWLLVNVHSTLSFILPQNTIVKGLILCKFLNQTHLHLLFHDQSKSQLQWINHYNKYMLKWQHLLKTIYNKHWYNTESTGHWFHFSFFSFPFTIERIFLFNRFITLKIFSSLHATEKIKKNSWKLISSNKNHTKLV